MVYGMNTKHKRGIGNRSTKHKCRYSVVTQYADIRERRKNEGTRLITVTPKAIQKQNNNNSNYFRSRLLPDLRIQDSVELERPSLAGHINALWAVKLIFRFLTEHCILSQTNSFT